MKLEQQKHLNRFSDDSIPLTWGVRFKMLEIVGPIMLLSAIFMIETLLLKGWMEGWSGKEIAGRLLIGVFGTGAVVFLALEMSIRLAHSSKRILEIKETALLIGRRDRPRRIRWIDLIAILLEPIPDEPGFVKISVWGRRRRTSAHTSSIVLNRTLQLSNFLSELRMRHQLNGSFTVREVQHPIPARKHSSGRIGWHYMLGVLLVLHGMFLAMPAFVDRSHPSEPKPAEKKLSPEFQRFVRTHFKSPDDLRKFFLVTGVALFGSGTVILSFEVRSINRFLRKRDKEIAETIEEQLRLAGKSILCPIN